VKECAQEERTESRTGLMITRASKEKHSEFIKEEKKIKKLDLDNFSFGFDHRSLG